MTEIAMDTWRLPPTILDYAPSARDWREAMRVRIAHDSPTAALVLLPAQPLLAGGLRRSEWVGFRLVRPNVSGITTYQFYLVMPGETGDAWMPLADLRMLDEAVREMGPQAACKGIAFEWTAYGRKLCAQAGG